jgi:ferredoxin-like protein FixX
MAMTIDDKLGLDKFVVDEENAHILIEKDCKDLAEKTKLTKICPAGLYKLDENQMLSFDYLGCLECGACRIIGLGKAIKEWDHPLGAMGVEYRLG